MPPMYLQPMVGFAFWHLERDWPIASIREAMQSQAVKRGWPSQHIDQAITEAIKVMSMTGIVQDYIDGSRRAREHGIIP